METHSIHPCSSRCQDYIHQCRQKTCFRPPGMTTICKDLQCTCYFQCCPAQVIYIDIRWSRSQSTAHKTPPNRQIRICPNLSNGEDLTSWSFPGAQTHRIDMSFFQFLHLLMISDAMTAPSCLCGATDIHEPVLQGGTCRNVKAWAFSHALAVAETSTIWHKGSTERSQHVGRCKVELQDFGSQNMVTRCPKIAEILVTAPKSAFKG